MSSSVTLVAAVSGFLPRLMFLLSPSLPKNSIVKVIRQQAGLHGAIREVRAVMCKSLGGLRSNCGTVVLVASALNSARDAGFCFNTHVVLHGARSDRKAVIGESLSLLLGKLCNCREGRVGSPLSAGDKNLKLRVTS